MTESGRASRIPHGDVLVTFAEAIVGREPGAIAAARAAVVAAMGVESMVDAAAVASNFERMVRIADATGIPIDQRMETYGRDVIDQLGLERFRARS